ncbi:SDR family oxidoreductase [Nonomuraea sp. NPDC046570]|uniref:SDR family NAD(P)-dependent oxidoreductase n=1 Tax=Nonomuraea sp. NPDC046570 TaxID=3155255 RepID=UPI0033D4DC09
MEELTRTCLLTGASGLLGTAFIRRYAARYQILAVHHRSAIDGPTQDQSYVDPLAPTRHLPENDHPVRALRADLGDPDDIARLADAVESHTDGVDLVVHAAAVRGWTPLLAAGAADRARWVYQVNVLAPLQLTAALARRFWFTDPTANLRANRNVVTISSTSGLFVYPDLQQGLYGSSKAALNHLTYHLASELWDLGIRVNAVAPDTFPGRIATEDVLDAIVDFDRSDRTGVVHRLDGRPA